MTLEAGREVGRQPPDGGWAWVVVISSFILIVLTVGITFSFGVIFVDLLDYFEESQSTTAWIGSIQAFLLNFTGQFEGQYQNSRCKIKNTQALYLNL